MPTLQLVTTQALLPGPWAGPEALHLCDSFLESAAAAAAWTGGGRWGVGSGRAGNAIERQQFYRHGGPMRPFPFSYENDLFLNRPSAPLWNVIGVILPETRGLADKTPTGLKFHICNFIEQGPPCPHTTKAPGATRSCLLAQASAGL